MQVVSSWDAYLLWTGTEMNKPLNMLKMWGWGALLAVGIATNPAFGIGMSAMSAPGVFGWLNPTEAQTRKLAESYGFSVSENTKVMDTQGLKYGFDVKHEPLYWGLEAPGSYDYMAYNMKSEQYYGYLEGLAAYNLELAEAAEAEELGELRAMYYRIGTESAQFSEQVAKQALSEETSRAEAAETALKEAEQQIQDLQNQAPAGVGKTYGKLPTTPAKVGIGARQSLKKMKGFQ